MKKMFALVDANCFYVSCERIFNPKLKNKPVIVLSNNDGCAVARSQEAKQMWVGMWEPYFKIKKKFWNDVIAQSSNYMLYGEISKRFHALASEYTQSQEIYSIDESFLDFTCTPSPDITAREIYHRCERDIWLPVCVWVWSTKTRAKLANHLAKKEKWFSGVCNLENIPHKQLQEIFARYDVWDLWWVWYGNALKLNELWIYSLLDLYMADPIGVRKHTSVIMEKTIRELQWESCLEIEEIGNKKKQIMTSRSFGKMLDSISELSEAVTYFATKWWEKLRQQKSRAGSLSVSIKSNRHREDLNQYNKSYTVVFPVPTDDSMTLIKWALFALSQIYKSGISYKKAGVRLWCLESGSFEKMNLFWDEVSSRKKNLMSTLDSLNKRFWRGTTLFASEWFSKTWAMNCDNRSPLYLHDWNDIPRCF